MRYYAELEIKALKIKISSRDENFTFSGIGDAYNWYMNQLIPMPCRIEYGAFHEIQPLKFCASDKGNYGDIIIRLIPE